MQIASQTLALIAQVSRSDVGCIDMQAHRWLHSAVGDFVYVPRNQRTAARTGIQLPDPRNDPEARPWPHSGRAARVSTPRSVMNAPALPPWSCQSVPGRVARSAAKPELRPRGRGASQ